MISEQNLTFDRNQQMETISCPNISTEELEELHKIFSIICSARPSESFQTIINVQSLNHKGIFLSSNMTAFIKQILQNQSLSSLNVTPIMQILSSKSTHEYGMGTWEAFVQVLNDWVNQSLYFTGPFKNRETMLFGPVERRTFHYFIGSFFLIMADCPQNNTIQILDSIIEKESYKFSFDYITPGTKLDSLTLAHEVSRLSQEFSQISEEVFRDYPIQKLNMILGIVVSKAPSPLNLLTHSNLLEKLMDLIFKNGIFKQALIAILKEEDFFQKKEAIRLVSYVLFCSKFLERHFGTSQSSQINECLFNPDFQQELLTMLFDLINTSPEFELREQSLVCLTFIGQVNESCMELISFEIVTKSPDYLVVEHSDQYLEALAFTLSCITNFVCSATYTNLLEDLLFGLIEAGSRLLVLRDVPSILCTGFEILSATLPRMKLTLDKPTLYNTLKRIMDLLALHSNITIKKRALITLKSILKSNDTQTEALINSNLLQTVSAILRSSEDSVKLLCCRIFRILVRKTYFLNYIEKNQLCTVMDIVRNVYSVSHWEGLRIVKDILGLSQPYGYSLIVNGTIKEIFAHLYKFKEEDQILKDVYNYKRVYYNLPYLLDCITTLDNLFTINKTLAGSENAFYVFANQFDQESVFQLQSVIEDLIEEKNEIIPQLSRSYIKPYADREFGPLLVNLIENIIDLHEVNKHVASRTIVTQLKSLLEVVTKEFIEGSVPGISDDDIDNDFILEVKCFVLNGLLSGDNRVIRVLISAPFSELLQAIGMEYEYNGPITVKYLTRNKREVVVDNDDIYQQVLKEVCSDISRVQGEAAEEIISMNIYIDFIDIHPKNINHRKEIKCCKCGKILGIIEVNEPKKTEKIIVCKECKQKAAYEAYGVWEEISNVTMSQEVQQNSWGVSFRG